MKKTILTLTIIAPNIAFAAGVSDWIDSAFDIVRNILTPLAFSLCLLYFFWGMVKYIKDGAASDKASTEGKRVMTQGIIGLFVVACVWAIIAYIQSELGIPGLETIKVLN